MNKKIKKMISSPVTIVVALILALFLLGTSTIGGAKAALTYYSETYASEVKLKDIGVTLMENGNEISNRDYIYEKADGSWDENTGVLLANMLEETGNVLQVGYAYTENIYAKNTGTIDEYVRVSVYKYWVDEKGEKVFDIDPAMIDLNIINLVGMDGEQCWIEDESARTEERSVYYYNKLLKTGEETPFLSDTITINADIAANVRSVVQGDTIVTTYEYSGDKFVLEVTVDAVQNHNAEDAILSAWGKNVKVEK